MKFYITVLFFLILVAAFAQTDNQPLKSHLFYEGGYRTGKILDIYPDSPESGQTRFYEMGLGWQSTGKNKWDQYYNFPQTGLMLSVGDLGNRSALGYNISIVSYLNLKLISKH